MRGLIVLLFAAMMGLGSASFAAPRCEIDRDHVTGGGDTPWPWGNEIRIPYSKVTGVWMTTSGDCRTDFIFKPSKPNARGERVTQITQYDPDACEIVSQGLGFEVGNVIRARMIGTKGAFDMSIHAFNENDVKDTQKSQCSNVPMGQGSVIVIKMFPQNGFDVNSVSYELLKLKNSTSMWCN